MQLDGSAVKPVDYFEKADYASKQQVEQQDR